VKARQILPFSLIAFFDYVWFWVDYLESAANIAAELSAAGALSDSRGFAGLRW
jgi:hypothetical protein